MTSSSTEKRDIRRFGAIAFCFFGSLFAISLWRGRTVMCLVFGVLSLFGLAFLLLPGPMRPAHAAWLRFGHGMGAASTAIILTLAYYLVVTPTALVKRLFGGRPLPLRPDPKASSYWVARPEPAQPRERFIKRY